MAPNIDDLLRDARPQFQPSALHGPDADTLHIFISEDESVAVRVDEILTIYETRGERRVTGIMLKGVRGLMQEAGGSLGLQIDPGGGLTAGTVVLAYLGLHADRLPEGVPTADLIKVGSKQKLELNG